MARERPEDVIAGLRKLRAEAGALAAELGLPDGAKYRLMSRLRVPAPETASFPTGLSALLERLKQGLQLDLSQIFPPAAPLPAHLSGVPAVAGANEATKDIGGVVVRLTAAQTALTVQVTDGDGNGVEALEVVLKPFVGSDLKRTSDETGTANFDNLPRGFPRRWTLSLRLP